MHSASLVKSKGIISVDPFAAVPHKWQQGGATLQPQPSKVMPSLVPLEEKAARSRMSLQWQTEALLLDMGRFLIVEAAVEAVVEVPALVGAQALAC